jgi:fumarate reductase flavoprotein subunit
MELVKEGGKVIGVDALVNGKLTRFTARGGVVLTSGDFTASSEYKQRYLPHVTHIDALNPSNTGDGQRMGEALGGTLLNGDILWGPSFRFGPGKVDSLAQRLPAWPWLTKCMEIALTKLPTAMFHPFILSFMTSTLAPEPSLLRAGAILVNREGRRFTDELGHPEIEVPKQSQKQAYIIFDEALAEKFSAWPNFVSTAPGIAYAYVADYQKQKGMYASGKTVADLAAAIGVPGEALQATIDSYADEIKRGAAEETRLPITRGPFHAIGPIMSWVVIAEGGLAVTERHEVVGQSGQPIDGLYAAGSVGQGGLILAGHGHHLGWAFTSGRRAGRFAAQRAAADSGRE